MDNKNKDVERNALVNSVGSEGANLKSESWLGIFWLCLLPGAMLFKSRLTLIPD